MPRVQDEAPESEGEGTQPGSIENFIFESAYDPSQMGLEGVGRIGITAFHEKLHGIYGSNDEIFTFLWEVMSERVNKLAHSKGFWADPLATANPTKFMLMVSEIAEAMEADRQGNPPSDHIPEFSGIEEELADTVIRIMDLSAQRGYRVGPAIIAKLAFNAGRPHMHGGKAY